MEKLAGQPVLSFQLIIKSPVPVLIVPGDGMSLGCEMGSDLMGLARDKMDLQQSNSCPGGGRVGVCLDHRRVFLFFLFDGYGIPFSVFCQITSDPAAFRHLSFHKTEIIFLKAPFPEHFAEFPERRERLSCRDDAACIPVQAVAH